MKHILSVVSALLFSILLLLHPAEAAGAVNQGLLICVRSVIPSLFPFMAAAGFLLKMGIAEQVSPLFAPLMKKLFGLSGHCAIPLLTGLVGGYPTGARAAAQLWRQGVLSSDEAQLLLGFCSNCGPAFLLGYVGTTILGSPRLGLKLWGIHVLSAFVTGLILCRTGRRHLRPSLPCASPEASPSAGKAFVSSVAEAADACFRITAFVVVFRVLLALTPVPFSPGIVEMVAGLSSLQTGADSLAAAAAITAWGGLSVHCQTMAVTDGLSLRWYWPGKLLHCGIAAFLAMLIG